MAILVVETRRGRDEPSSSTSTDRVPPTVTEAGRNDSNSDSSDGNGQPSRRHRNRIPHKLSIVRDHLSFERTFLSFYRLSTAAIVLGASLFFEDLLPFHHPTNRFVSYGWIALGLGSLGLSIGFYFYLLKQYWLSYHFQNHYPTAVVTVVMLIALTYGLLYLVI
ncbi:hypothetical protein H4R34_001919 [Dimargaris verticillata]|uniref:DUF202 domain-containing protein n=1 Tax=Dimargaris verticillata TaxID=2761393 RepID=A0A9W8EE19_9FUNG|nr:hypothetical protein H4R34_001919 [Dimargaris verticillata]